MAWYRCLLWNEAQKAVLLNTARITILHNRTDIVLIESNKKTAEIINIAVPNGGNTNSVCAGKNLKYQTLAAKL
ncbi:unnamed protein product, partial [Nezara viridula]